MSEAQPDPTTSDRLVLTPQNVESVFKSCLFAEGEDTSRAVLVEGPAMRAGLCARRLGEALPDIAALLGQLPEGFSSDSEEGGLSFLAACDNREGELWTGDHQVMDMLFLLGLAVQLVSCPVPRKYWSALPGGMPYYSVTP